MYASIVWRLVRLPEAESPVSRFGYVSVNVNNKCANSLII